MADFHNPGIYGSGQVWANAWDVFCRASSRGGHVRQAPAAFVVCSGWGGFFLVFLSTFFLFRTHTAFCKYEATSCLVYISTSNDTEARPRERSDRGRFLPLGKKASSYRGVYRVSLFNLSVGMRVCVCVTFVVLTDCESCTRPISTKPGIYGNGRVRPFFAFRQKASSYRGAYRVPYLISLSVCLSV